MLKTWDVQPAATADGDVAARPTLSQGGLPEAGGFTDPSALDFSRAVNIWGCLRRGVWTREETLRELKYVEAGLPPCDSCRLRSGVVNEYGMKVCGECKNGGRRPTGDEIDRGWDDYKDRT